MWSCRCMSTCLLKVHNCIVKTLGQWSDSNVILYILWCQHKPAFHKRVLPKTVPKERQIASVKWTFSKSLLNRATEQYIVAALQAGHRSVLSRKNNATCWLFIRREIHNRFLVLESKNVLYQRRQQLHVLLQIILYINYSMHVRVW